MSILKKQKGAALVFAILVSVVMLIMVYVLFALSRNSVILNQVEDEKFADKNNLKTIVDNELTNLTYNSNILPSSSTSETKTLNNGSISYTVEKSNNTIVDSKHDLLKSFIIPESGYTMRVVNYYINILFNNHLREAIVRVPSTTKKSTSSELDKSTISLNVPAVDIHNLYSTQLNSSGSFTDTQVGYIGSLSVDNNNYTLTFIDTSGNSSSLNLPSDFNPGTYALSQGWELINGSWNISIGVYGLDNTKGCVIQAPLTTFLSGISSLQCIPLQASNSPVSNAIKYPDPTGYYPCSDTLLYQPGDICKQDGMLFEARYVNTFGLPLEHNVNGAPIRNRNYKVYYPDPTWIAPYIQGVNYDSGSQVAYAGIIFKATKDQPTTDPFGSSSWFLVDGWRVNGIYNWNQHIRYQPNDIVIYNGNFYQAKQEVSNIANSIIYPTNKDYWKKLGGKKLKQKDINKIDPEYRGNAQAGTTVSDYQPAKIIFPYRNPNPTQQELNTKGEYPPIDTDIYQQCIHGTSYQVGDRCYENNLLFEAIANDSNSPYNAAQSWKVYIPPTSSTGLDWVMPYSNNVVYYDSGIKVIYNDKRWVSRWYIDPAIEQAPPYEGWRIDDIYLWDPNITYEADDIVIRNGGYYKALQWHKNKDPSTETAYWTYLGSTPSSGDTWDPATSYKLGDPVIYGGTTYVSQQDNNINNTPPISPTMWQTPYVQDEPWNQYRYYYVGQTVTHNGQLYENILKGITTLYEPGTASGQWHWQTAHVPDSPWDPNRIYLQGQTVTYNGSIYTAILDNTYTNRGLQPDAYPNAWEQQIDPNSNEWNANTQYYAGDIVTWNNIEYIALVDNPWNIEPGTALAVTRWNKVLPDGSKWDSYQTYFIGDTVTYQGHTYQSKSNGIYGNATSPQTANWTLIS